MIEPFLSDNAFLADVAAARVQPGLHLWWLGQSGFLITFDGTAILLDPYLSDSLTTKYANTDKPHVRMTRRVVDPRRLDFVSLITSSHTHTDHLDPDTLKPILEVNRDVVLVIPEASRKLVAERLSIDPAQPVGMDAGDTAVVAGVGITALPAAHETIELDDQGRCRFLGYVLRVGRWRIYHSGDTILYDGMVDRLCELPPVDLALLPINGRAPERRVAGNLSGPEAARLAHDVGARLVVPCHYDMFTFNTASPESFVAECRALGQPYRVLRAGERLTL